MIDLREYQPSWADRYRREAARVSEALAGLITSVEHIGSTAVPGLTAKPIIDLAARSRHGTAATDLEAPLARIGYVRHTSGPKNHVVHVKLDGERHRTHILHVFRPEQWTHCDQRLFRDKLIHDPDARRRYRSLKESLASLEDGREYTAAKQPLIEELLNEERASRGLPPTIAGDK
ncbi:GrpB family protein [Rathayibacter sp. PhB127]|uniref:GrpB family protein n=1 Tax=Rathayibacter sp. PhB127 TaxID=2485176 RepID=UPI000F4CE005|nr:GrpB family protein [Rathayibacter sp. PhB127]